MIKSVSGRKEQHKAGKSFVFLFNRVMMYGPTHPYSVQAAEDFFQSFMELLAKTAPAVLIFSREQFFLEDDPLDPNLNCAKMASHFKRANVTSVSIQQGLQKREVEEFVKVFLDAKSYPGAEQMKAELVRQHVENIRINHIFFKKVTEDDEVVAKSVAEQAGKLSGELDSAHQYQEALGLIAGKLLTEEMDQSLCLKSLLADPDSFSKDMVARSRAAPAGGGPYSITGHLGALSQEINGTLAAGSSIALEELAEALVKMKRTLRDEIEAQKALGLLLDPQNEAFQLAETLSDRVVLDLICKEYEQGRTPVERLAFILKRILPLPEDLRRLLPAVKTRLLQEGMPLADFLRLIQLMDVEQQNEAIVQEIHQAAEEIGIDGGDLLRRLKADPTGFARFLYLAAEIEKEAGSAKPLCDILVDQVERLNPRLLQGQDGADPAAGEQALRQIIRQLNAKVVDGLRQGPADPKLISDLEERLKKRLDSTVRAIRSELEGYRSTLKADASSPCSLLQNLEESLAEDHELKRVLKEVRAGFREQGRDENDFVQILERIEELKEKKRKKAQTLEEFVFGRQQTLALLEIEIARAARYATDLTGIAFSIYRTAGPNSTAGAEAVSLEVTTAILQKMREKLRSTDWIGILDGRLFLALMPMTTVKEAHLASRRLMKALNADPVIVAGRPVPFRVAGSVVHYDRKRMAGAEAFISVAQREQAEKAHRLRNLNSLM
jgi:hypothetical protein